MASRNGAGTGPAPTPENVGAAPVASRKMGGACSRPYMVKYGNLPYKISSYLNIQVTKTTGRLRAGQTFQELAQSAIELLGVLQVGEVSRLGDDLQPRAGDRLSHALGIGGRSKHIALPD